MPYIWGLGGLSQRTLIPPERRWDVVYFNPGDLEWPVGLNILSGVPHDARHLVVSSFLETCKSLWWPDADYPRLEYVLGHALLALLEIEGATLLGVHKLLTAASYRASVTKRLTDPVVRGFWSVEYEGYGPKL